MANPLKKLIGIEVTFGEEIDETADVNLHMPWHFLTDYEPTGESKHIIVFTHLNKGAEPGLYKTAKTQDNPGAKILLPRSRRCQPSGNTGKDRVGLIISMPGKTDAQDR